MSYKLNFNKLINSNLLRKVQMKIKTYFKFLTNKSIKILKLMKFLLINFINTIYLKIKIKTKETNIINQNTLQLSKSHKN